jgi:hypothetical protein
MACVVKNNSLIAFPFICEKKTSKAYGFYSENYQYRPKGRRSLAKLLPKVVSATDPLGRFLNEILYFFMQVAPQLSSQDCVDPIPDPLLLGRSENLIALGIKSGTFESVARHSGH